MRDLLFVDFVLRRSCWAPRARRRTQAGCSSCLTRWTGKSQAASAEAGRYQEANCGCRALCRSREEEARRGSPPIRNRHQLARPVAPGHEPAGEAEPLDARALAIDEQSYGPDHPKVAIRLNNLAELLQATNWLAEAEPLMRRALAIDEKRYGPDHPNVANRLNNLARLLQETNRLAEAEPLIRRALGHR